MNSLKICFMGTPEIAAIVLRKILEKHEISTVYTKPPKPQKRGLKVTNSFAHLEALKHNIKVYHPNTFKKAKDIEEFINLNFDLAIVVAYGIILPRTIFTAPKFGTINLHGSLLPKWRGAAPIQRAIEAGETYTGATIMYIDEGLDSGNIIYQEKIPINDTTTSSDLFKNMADIGSKLLIKVIDQLKAQKTLPSIKQDENLATYAKILKKEEKYLDFNNSAFNIIRKINAFDIFPGSYFTYKNETFKIIKAHEVTKEEIKAITRYSQLDLKLENNTPGDVIITNNSLYISAIDNFISVDIIQRASKKALSIKEFLKGYKYNIK